MKLNHVSTFLGKGQPVIVIFQSYLNVNLCRCYSHPLFRGLFPEIVITEIYLSIQTAKA